MKYLTELNNIFGNIINYNSINKDKIYILNQGYERSGRVKNKFYAGTSFTRRAFDSKNKNIILSTFIKLHSEILKLANNIFKNPENEKILLAVDGTNNRNNNHQVMLNMGYFDITNDIHVFIDIHGAENRNKEVSTLMDTIKKHPDRFQNVILIGDRGYFTYKLMTFLIEHKIGFVIRARGIAAKLDLSNKLAKNTPDYETIKKLRESVRVIKYIKAIDKNVYASNGKNIKARKHLVKLNNDCVLITNLTDKAEFPKEKIMEIYRSRWDIETFFGFIKNNCKFQNMPIDYNYDIYQKMCIL